MQAMSFALDSSDLLITVSQDQDGTYTISTGVLSEDSKDTALSGMTFQEVKRLARAIQDLAREHRLETTDSDDPFGW